MDSFSRKHVVAALALSLGLTVASAGVNAQEITLKAGTTMPPPMPISFMLTDVLAPRLAELTDGRLVLEVSLAGATCAEASCVEQVSLGQVDMATVSVANYGGFGSTFEVLTLPYIFQSDASAEKVFNDFLIEEMRNQGAANEGLKVIAIAPMFGFRSLQVSNESIRVPADMNNIKIRVTTSPLDAALINAWGGTPIPVNWPGTFDALQQKVVDGTYVQNSMALARSFQSEAPRFVKTGGAYTPMMFFMNQEKFDSLPDWAQDAINTASLELQSQVFEIDAEFTAKFEGKIGEANLYEPNASELALWQSAALTAWSAAEGLYDKGLARRILEAQEGTATVISDLEALGAL